MGPFPFIGDGESKRSELWVVTTSSPAEALLEHFPEATLRADGRVGLLWWKQQPADLAELLQVVHHALPLSLAVRPGRPKATAWHRASLKDERVFEALGAVVKEAINYAGRLFTLTGNRDVSVQLYERLDGQAPRAELVKATVRVMLDTSPGKSRAAMVERLERTLPPLMGADFAVDVAIRNLLAQVRAQPVNTVKMSAAFDAEMVRQMKGTHGAPQKQKPGAVDWASRDAVLAAVAAERWAEVSGALREQDDAHVATVCSLEAETLLLLAKGDRDFSTRLANIATALLPQNDFETVLRLYDAALEGTLHPMAAGNPLYAVQDDWHHQGVDVTRARRYLERCLPHGVKNPAVFLNAAGVFMELGEPAEALAKLELAKKHGFDVRPHRNEKSFEPLKHDPRFQKLMGLK
jgi:tetratricopeptide (TPR) repeat protein